MATESVRLREQGNTFYLRALNEGLSPFLVKDRLSQALKCYYQAKRNAASANEASSALKNIGKAHYQMARTIRRESTLTRLAQKVSEKEMEKQEYEIRFHAKEALNELFSSLQSGAGQPEYWRDKMHSDIALVFSEAVTLVSFGQFDRRVASMFVLAECMKWKELRALLLVQIGQVLYQHSVRSLEEKNFRESLRAVHEMNYPLEEAERMTSHEETQTDIRVLKNDAIYQLASAESMQTTSIACKQLSMVMQNDEFLNMNMVFDTLDMFKDAALKAREIDLEQEAIACYYQGHIFEKVLKLRQKAKTFYMKVMELTEAAKPKLFHRETWYQECTSSLKVMQNEARERDEKAQEEIKAKLRKELESELNSLAAAQNTHSPVELLKHVYSKHPPKSKKPKLDIKEVEGWDDKEGSDKKRIFIKAMSDYHPDKNSSEEFGEKWHFLTEEISKSLTHFHEMLK